MRGVPARRTTVHIDGWLRVGCRHAIAIDITTVDGVIFVFSLLRNTLMKENPAFSLFGRTGFSRSSPIKCRSSRSCKSQHVEDTPTSFVTQTTFGYNCIFQNNFPLEIFKANRESPPGTSAYPLGLASCVTSRGTRRSRRTRSPEAWPCTVLHGNSSTK